MTKAVRVLLGMVKHPEQVKLIEFFPYRTGLVQVAYTANGRGGVQRDENLTVVVEYSNWKPEYPRLARAVNRLENILLGQRRDNHICAIVEYNGEAHAVAFSDWRFRLACHGTVAARRW